MSLIGVLCFFVDFSGFVALAIGGGFIGGVLFLHEICELEGNCGAEVFLHSALVGLTHCGYFCEIFITNILAMAIWCREVRDFS